MKLKHILLFCLVLCVAVPAMSQGKVSRTGTTTTTKTPAKRNTPKSKTPKTRKPARAENKLIVSAQLIGNTDRDGNIIDDYGNALYASTLRFARQKIFYYGLTSPVTKSVYYRLITPQGKVLQDNSSPNGFTWKQDVTFKPGSNSHISFGWGNDRVGVYTTGTYISEVWIDGQCVSSQSFYVF